MLSTRRLFLGSAVAAAMPLITRGDLHAVAPASPPSPPLVPDPVLSELVRQLEELKQLAAAPAPQMGEIMRRHAANLRLRAAHAKTLQLDARVRRELKTRIAREGREALLHDRKVVDLAASNAAIDEMLRNGVTPTWVTVATQLESSARKADLRGPLHPVRRQQEDPCHAMQRMLLLLEATQIALCLLAIAAGPEFCIIAQIDTLLWRAYMYYMGC